MNSHFALVRGHPGGVEGDLRSGSLKTRTLIRCWNTLGQSGKFYVSCIQSKMAETIANQIEMFES